MAELKVALITPLGLVGPLEGEKVPPPVALSTTMPLLIGFPLASRAVTVMVEVPTTGAMEVGSAARVETPGDTAPAVTLMVVEMTSVRLAALKRRVRPPATPVIDRLANVATPLPFVVAVGVPPRFPPPEAIAAVTITWS